MSLQGMKNFTRTAANLVAAMAKIDNNYYPEVPSLFMLFLLLLYLFLIVHHLY